MDVELKNEEVECPINENPRNMPVLQGEEKFCYQRYPFISSTCLSLVTGMSILKSRKIPKKSGFTLWIKSKFQNFSLKLKQ